MDNTTTDKISLTDDDGDVLPAYMVGWLTGQAEVYCECVARGVKPLASMFFQEEYLSHVEGVIKEWGLDWRVCDDDMPGWVSVYVYLDDVIMDAFIAFGDTEPSSADAVIMGLFFGYAPWAISGYVEAAKEDGNGVDTGTSLTTA